VIEKKKVELPLFSCYVFVKLVFGNNEARMRVIAPNGVFGIVSMRGRSDPHSGGTDRSPPHRGHAKNCLVGSRFSESRTTVRIRGGSLDGVGRRAAFPRWRPDAVISVDAIQRSLCSTGRSYEVEPL